MGPGGSGRRRRPIRAASQHVQSAKSAGPGVHRYRGQLTAGQRGGGPPGGPRRRHGREPRSAGERDDACCHRWLTSSVGILQVGSARTPLRPAPGTGNAGEPRSPVGGGTPLETSCKPAQVPVFWRRAVAGQGRPADVADHRQMRFLVVSWSVRGRHLLTALWYPGRRSLGATEPLSLRRSRDPRRTPIRMS
jgi:hypothetical protein